jgi:putative DNA primase/helicase
MLARWFGNHIPQELMCRDRWICWRLQLRNGKRTKAPINPHTGQLTSVRDSSAWSSFAQAKKGWEQFGCDGLGFVLNGDGLIAIDLDDCVTWDGESFRIDARADIAIRAVNSYTEFSPSRKGIHLFAFGTLPERGRRNDLAHFEIYSDGQFLTVTGDVVPGGPTRIEPRSRELRTLHQQFFGTSGASNGKSSSRYRAGARSTHFQDSDDEALLDLARAALNGPVFSALFDRGDTSRYGDDHSKADFVLCMILAFWTNKDPVRIDRLFRRSALFREVKWDRGGTFPYGQRTIEKAIERVTHTWTPHQPKTCK